jgi:hypothetical protein
MKYIVVYMSEGLDLYTEAFDTLEEAQAWAAKSNHKNVILYGEVHEVNN